MCQACQFCNLGGHCCLACGSSAWLTLSLQVPTDRTLIDSAANAVVYLQPDVALLTTRVQALGRGFMQRMRNRREKAATLLAYAWRAYAEKKAQVCAIACLIIFSSDAHTLHRINTIVVRERRSERYRHQ